MTAALDLPYPVYDFVISQKSLNQVSDKTLLVKYTDSSALRALEEELDELRKARLARRLKMHSVTSTVPIASPLLPLVRPVRRPKDTKSLSPTPPPTPPHTVPYVLPPSPEEAYEGKVKLTPTFDQPLSKEDEKDTRAASDIESGEDQEQVKPVAVSLIEPVVMPAALTEPLAKESHALEQQSPKEEEPKTSCDTKDSQPATKEASTPKSLKERLVRSPLKIETTFERSPPKSVNEAQETDLYSQIRKNLRSTPSTPQPRPSKSATFEGVSPSPGQPRPDIKRNKRASVPAIPQSSLSLQTTDKIPPKDESTYKPKQLKDAFIGVKDLTKKFSNSTTDEHTSSAKLRPFMKQTLSDASLSVSRQRRTSAPPQSMTNLFTRQSSNNKPSPTEKHLEAENKPQGRRPKPLPQINFYEMKQPSTATAVPQPQQQPIKSHDSVGDHSFRICRKPMPPIPVSEESNTDQALVYPNPIPAYEPQLSRKASPPPRQKELPNVEDEKKFCVDQSRPENKEGPVTFPASEAGENKHVDNHSSASTIEQGPLETSPFTLAIVETPKPKKRVSFSSIVTDIPPPTSPLSYTSDEGESENNRTSSGILSRWQQQHQVDRFRSTFRESKTVSSDLPSGDARGFWEAFSSEMSSRTPTDHRKKAANDTPSSTSTRPRVQLDPSSNRFTPPTLFKNGAKPITSDAATRRASNTWINALQQSVSTRLSLKTNSSNNNQDTKPGLSEQADTAPAIPSREAGSLARKPVGATVLDERVSQSPPLNHPTKSRPMKPSSLRKSKSSPSSSYYAGSSTEQIIARPPVAAKPQWWIKVDHP